MCSLVSYSRVYIVNHSTYFRTLWHGSLASVKLDPRHTVGTPATVQLAGLRICDDRLLVSKLLQTLERFFHMNRQRVVQFVGALTNQCQLVGPYLG